MPMKCAPRSVLVAIAALGAVLAALACNPEPHVNVGKAKSLANVAGNSAGNGAGAAGDGEDEHEGSAGEDEEGSAGDDHTDEERNDGV
jgi:hypothetical protein